MSLHLLKCMSKLKSPLRYPGGKTRAVSIIYDLVPKDTKELCSPFFGGGSVELHCVNNGIKVSGYDSFVPLTDFWHCLLKNRYRLAKLVETKYFPLAKDQFYKLQKDPRSFIDKGQRLGIYNRGATFFALNRASFSGSTLSGGMSPDHPRFNEASIKRLRKFVVQLKENLSIENMDFKYSIPKHPESLLYLDPPYLIKGALYGKNGNMHKNFEHEALVDILKKRDNWILSYNNCPEVLEWYKDYTIHFPDWKYGMSNDKSSKEVLIVSKDIG